MSLLAELKRRNVIRMAVLYLVGAWLIVQVAGTVLPMFGAPAWLPRSIVVLLALGFVPTLVFSWVFELTPEGLKRDAAVTPEHSIAPQTGRRMDRMIVAGLFAVILLMAADRFWRRDASSPGASNETKVSDVSIAVLPLANLSGDPTQEYFSDGMSEELLNGLTKVAGLRVAARTSSFQFKGKNLDIQEIGRQLNVATVLEGSLRKSGRRVRITTQLIDARSGYHLWSETYDRELDDIFTIQDDIAAKVVQELRTRLGLAQAAETPPVPTQSTSTEAYDAYLRGRALLRNPDSKSVALGLAALQRSTTLDPEYAPAWAQLAHAHFISRRAATGFGNIPMSEADPLARAALANAKRLDPELADAFAVEGLLEQFLDGDLDAASKAFDHAIARNPSHADALSWRSDLMARMGRYRDALESRIELARIDPLFGANNEAIVNQLSLFGRNEEAKPFLDRVFKNSPTSSYYVLAGQFAHQAQWDLLALELLRNYEEAVLVYGGRRWLMYQFTMLGMFDDAEQVHADDSEIPAAGRGDWIGAVATIDANGIQTADQRRSFWYYRRGQALYRAGRTADAIEQFELVDRIFPFGLADDAVYVSPRRIWHALALREVGREADAARIEGYTRADLAAARRDGLVIPTVDLLAAEVALFDGDEDSALKFLPRGLMAEPFLASVETDPLYANVLDRVEFKRAVSGERERRGIMRNNFLRKVCNAPATAAWRPLPASCASLSSEPVHKP